MTVQQALEDPKFKYFFNDELLRIRSKRNNIINSFGSGKLKSDAFSVLDRMLFFTNYEKIIREYSLIWFKKSLLPKRERDWLQDFTKVIIARIILYYDTKDIK